MPLHFIPNLGQADERIDFYIQGKDKAVYFTPAGLTLILTAADQAESGSSPPRMESRPQVEVIKPGQRWVVKLDFLGANPGVHPQGEEKTGAAVSYFRGRPEDWKTGLSTYSRIFYPDLWPGIDLSYSADETAIDEYRGVENEGSGPVIFSDLEPVDEGPVLRTALDPVSQGNVCPLSSCILVGRRHIVPEASGRCLHDKPTVLVDLYGLRPAIGQPYERRIRPRMDDELILQPARGAGIGEVDPRPEIGIEDP